MMRFGRRERESQQPVPLGVLSPEERASVLRIKAIYDCQVAMEEPDWHQAERLLCRLEFARELVAAGRLSK